MSRDLVGAGVILPLLASLLVACQVPEGDAEPRTPPATVVTWTEPPAQPASVRGVITSVDPVAGIRVEENPADETGSAKALIRRTDTTRLLYRDGEPLDASELTIGHNVSVWFIGEVAESYPLQATAGVLVIEPAGGS